jgi:hypothetical protein
MPVCSRGMVKPYMIATDSILVKANKGHVWHKSSMEKGLVPHSGIDTDANGASAMPSDGHLGTLHMKSSNGSIAIPLSAGATTANVQDNQAYEGLTSSMPLETIMKAHFMTAGLQDTMIRTSMS